MDTAAELGRIPVSTRFSLSMEMSRLTRDGTAEPVSQFQILRRERGQGNIHFPCSAENEQDWQAYRVDPYSLVFNIAICVNIHTSTSDQSQQARGRGPASANAHEARTCKLPARAAP